MTQEQAALWAMIISGVTLLVYLGQLVVLILIYFRVIKETDRNAEQRRHEIEKAGEQIQEINKNAERGLNKIAKRNTIGMALMCICLMGMVIIDDRRIREIKKKFLKEEKPETE